MLACGASALLAPASVPRASVVQRRGLDVVVGSATPTRQQYAEVVSEATSVPSALADLWSVIASAPAEGRVVSFDKCEALREKSVFAAVFEHLEVCKDSCDSFGTRIVAVPDGLGRVVVRNSAGYTGGTRSGGAYGAYDIDEDDDDDDWELSPEMAAMLADAGVQKRKETDAAAAAKSKAKLEALAALDDEGVLRCCKDWVNAIVSDAGICPFSLSADRAGLPIGDVRYDVMRARDAESSYAWYWREVEWLEQHPKAATSLLVLSDTFWTVEKSNLERHFN